MQLDANLPSLDRIYRCMLKALCIKNQNEYCSRQEDKTNEMRASIKHSTFTLTDLNWGQFFRFFRSLLNLLVKLVTEILLFERYIWSISDFSYSFLWYDCPLVTGGDFLKAFTIMKVYTTSIRWFWKYLGKNCKISVTLW